jgi:hypothetical protein
MHPIPSDWQQVVEQPSMLPAGHIAHGTVWHPVTRRWQPWIYLGGDAIICLCSHPDQQVAAELGSGLPAVWRALQAGETALVDAFAARLQAAPLADPLPYHTHAALLRVLRMHGAVVGH